MGRQFPEQTHHHPHPHPPPTPPHHLIYPILSLSLFITSMAAILALLTSLCAVWKKPAPAGQDHSFTPAEEQQTTAPDNNNNNNNNDDDDDDQFAVASPPSETDDQNEEKKQALPLPPGMVAGTALPADYKKMRTKSMASISAAAAGTTSKKMTLTSLGNKVMQAKRENELKHEDSLWKKRIILGDKCKGPNANINNNEEKQQESNPNAPPQPPHE